ncbi:hypothetical protein MCP1_170073 [Candidatus Terasakiella magnetica]|nr:hypothetical protein MCP1_170073 [Candidatus Terasakiella magnetica]
MPCLPTGGSHASYGTKHLSGHRGDAGGKDKPTADALDKTSFFPGGKPENRPTAYDVDMANYAYIPEKGCGVTQESLSDLTTLAGAAGDMAATVDGLTLNSFGGVHYGLGVMGKFSIGDNQTLTVLVKTALSRLSKRITYASGYWLLHGLGEPGSPKPAPSYLQIQ